MTEFHYLALLLCFAAPVDDNGSAFQSLIDTWRSSADAIWSYDAYVTVRVRSYSRDREEMMVVGKYEIRQRYLHGMWRVDFLKTRRIFSSGKETHWNSSGDSVKAYAWDGEVVRFYSSPDNFGQIQSRLSFARAKLLAPNLFEGFKSHFLGEALPTMVEDREPESVDRTAPGVVLLDLPAMPTSPPSHTYAGLDFEIEIDERVGGLPTMIKYGKNLDSNPSSFTVLELKYTRVRQGVFAPIEFFSSVYSNSKRFRGTTAKPATVRVLRVDLERSRFNINIAPEVFTLSIPPGTIIYNKESGENFLKTEGDAKDYRAYEKLIAQRFGKKLPDLKPADLREVTPGRNIFLISLVSINLIILVAVGVFVFKRRRR